MSLRIKVIPHNKALFSIKISMYWKSNQRLQQATHRSLPHLWVEVTQWSFCLSSTTLTDEISNQSQIRCERGVLVVRCKVSGSLKRRRLSVSASSGPVLWHLQPGRQRSSPSHHQRHRRDGAMVAESATVPQHRVQRGERHSGPRTGKDQCFLSECCGSGRVQESLSRESRLLWNFLDVQKF